MNEDIEVGDLVTPISDICGLWLANSPINGDYYQKRNNVCVFKGVGKVLKVNKTIIDYDEWCEQDRINGVGDFSRYKIFFQRHGGKTNKVLRL